MSEAKKSAAAGEIAKIFEDHFAALPQAERAKREIAFDKAISKIGSPAKS